MYPAFVPLSDPVPANNKRPRLPAQPVVEALCFVAILLFFQLI